MLSPSLLLSTLGCRQLESAPADLDDLLHTLWAEGPDSSSLEDDEAGLDEVAVARAGGR